LRLFIAIHTPEKIKGKIEKTFSKKILSKIKKVEKENLHITLFFIGERDAKETQEIIQKFNEIIYTQFKISLKGIGSFGNKVIWLGVEKGLKELIELNKIISLRLNGKNERFHGHLTLARNKNFEKEFFDILDELKKHGFEEEFEVDKIFLMKSVLEEKGPIYSIVSERTFSNNVSGS